MPSDNCELFDNETQPACFACEQYDVGMVCSRHWPGPKMVSRCLRKIAGFPHLGAKCREYSREPGAEG